MSTVLLAVTAIGTDRPGIVAAVTRVLYELGCNLEDATSTILRGHFAIMLIVRTGEGVDAAAAERALGAVADESDLLITVREVQEAGTEIEPPTHMISVYGGDRPGILYRVAHRLADRGVNVTDLTSRVLGEEERPVYAVMLEVAAPPEVDLSRDLDDLRKQLDVEISISPIEADIL